MKVIRRIFGKALVPISAEEKEATLTAIDMYLSGMDDARDQTISDHTINSAEELLMLTDGLESTRWHLTSMKRKLEHVG